MEIVGLSEEKVRKISEIKNEDNWVSDYRLKGYKSFVEQYFKAIEDLEEIWKRWNDPNYLLPAYFRKSPNFDKGKTE